LQFNSFCKILTAIAHLNVCYIGCPRDLKQK